MQSTTFRFPDTFKTASAVAVGVSGTLWTPTSGTKFRLMYMHIFGSVAGVYTFKDGSTTIATIYLDGNSPQLIPLGPVGILSAAKDNVLTCVGPSNPSALSGLIYGVEEGANVTA